MQSYGPLWIKWSYKPGAALAPVHPSMDGRINWRGRGTFRNNWNPRKFGEIPEFYSYFRWEIRCPSKFHMDGHRCYSKRLAPRGLRERERKSQNMEFTIYHPSGTGRMGERCWNHKSFSHYMSLTVFSLPHHWPLLMFFHCLVVCLAHYTVHF